MEKLFLKITAKLCSITSLLASFLHIALVNFNSLEAAALSIREYIFLRRSALCLRYTLALSDGT